MKHNNTTLFKHSLQTWFWICLHPSPHKLFYIFPCFGIILGLTVASATLFPKKFFFYSSVHWNFYFNSTKIILVQQIFIGLTFNQIFTDPTTCSSCLFVSTQSFFLFYSIQYVKSYLQIESSMEDKELRVCVQNEGRW